MGGEHLEEKNELFNILINNIMRIVKSATNRNEKLTSICKLLKERVPYYNWVGFYIADEKKNELTLGPFAGEPTEHTNINFGQGICGQAAAKKKSFIVQDVTKESNYLSCSPDVKSEIVLPILKNNEIKAELDIDSHSSAPFTKEDEDFLNNVCNTLSGLF
jgi:GAF domain-containing protein